MDLTDEEKNKLFEKKEQITTQELVQILIILKEEKIDLSKIKITNTYTLWELINDKENAEEILQRLQEISDEIDKNWLIGRRINSQKSRNYEQFIEEIEKVGLNLMDEEKKVILEKKENLTIEKFVQVLKVLKEEKIDLSKIKIINTYILGDLISKEEKAEEILQRLQEISDEIDENWPIGDRLRNRKVRNYEQLIEEIEKAGLELTEEERKVLLEKENNQVKSKRVTEEFIQVLKILKEEGIDLSKIKIINTYTLWELICDKENAEEIIQKLQEISDKIDKNWLIGNRLINQKSKENLEQFKEEIEKAELELTKEERKVLLEVKGQITTEKIVQVLKILKEEGVDLSNIKQNGKESKLSYLIQNKKNAEKIIQKLQEISEEIDENWPIGGRVNKQKSKRNIEMFKSEIEKAGLELTEEERQVLLEIKENQYKIISTEEFIQVLKVLKEEEIDLSKIRITNTYTLWELISDKENAEEIIRRLQEISGDIDENWPIGNRLNNQKSRNYEQFLDEIEKLGIELTEEERKVLLYKENVKEESERKTKELVQIFILLKEEKIDLSKIRITNTYTLWELISDKENAEEIIQKLKEISDEIDKNWRIGKRINAQKSKNFIQFREEIEKADLELTEKERKKLLYFRTKKTNSIDIQQATQEASTQGCDEKQIFMKQLEKQIEEQEKVS